APKKGGEGRLHEFPGDRKFYERSDNTKRRRRRHGRGTTAREVNQKSAHRRPPHLVSGLRRFRGARRLLQGVGETPARSRKDCDSCGKRVLVALPLFRQ